MKNRIKSQNEEQTQQEAPKRKSRRLSRAVTRLLNGEFLTEEGVVRHMPFMLYVTGFFLLTIYLGYYFDNTEREKAKVKITLEELSAEYKTLKSELEARKQQSSVARSISDLGLDEPNEPPVVIEPNEAALEESE
jgi:hypothetical protein